METLLTSDLDDRCEFELAYCERCKNEDPNLTETVCPSQCAIRTKFWWNGYGNKTFPKEITRPLDTNGKVCYTCDAFVPRA